MLERGWIWMVPRIFEGRLRGAGCDMSEDARVKTSPG